MKANFRALSTNDFNIKEYDFHGDLLYLVTPKAIMTKFIPETLIFRSSVWDGEGNPVSFSFKKFYNYGEQPLLNPLINDLSVVNILQKMDGMLVSITKYKGNLIIRTRGNLFADKTPKCGHEIELLKIKYPKVFSAANEDYSIICEWLSPSNPIVIPVKEPELYLIGLIYHKDYAYMSQEMLDFLAKELDIKRPKRYKFNTFAELQNSVGVKKDTKSADSLDVLSSIKDSPNVNFEGYCLYYQNDQNIAKLKTDWYLAMHSLKENIYVNVKGIRKISLNKA